MLIARGDVVHAGAGHTDDNLRVHFYFDPPKGDITWRKQNTFYFTDEIKWYDYGAFYQQRRLNGEKKVLSTSEKRKRIREKLMNARKFSAKGRAIEDAVCEEAEPVL